MQETPWSQVNIAFPGDSPQERERHAVAHLHQTLPAAEAAGLISSWWFTRKGPWRIRYRLCAGGIDPDQVRHAITGEFVWTGDIYEPEIHAFGGTESMDVAHTLFHGDSRQILPYLRRHPTNRRERSIVLCTAFLRSAGFDLNEQGDVWARVADKRVAAGGEHATADPLTWAGFTYKVQQLLIGSAAAIEWQTAFHDAGSDLRRLRESGRLTRGVRAVAAEHVIFHWNRIGLPGFTQGILAQAAKEAIFGPARLAVRLGDQPTPRSQ